MTTNRRDFDIDTPRSFALPPKSWTRLHTGLLALSGLISLGVAILATFGFAMATPSAQLAALRADHAEVGTRLRQDSIYWAAENRRQDSIMGRVMLNTEALLVFRCMETAPSVMRQKGQFATATLCETLLRTGRTQ